MIGAGTGTDEGPEDAGGIEESWVSESVGALLTSCVESGEDVADCWLCDCDVSGEIGNCGELRKDVGCCVG